MTSTTTSFTGDIPLNYDQGLGPNLFDRYGREVADRAAAAEPASVLELAAGTGIVTRHLRNALPSDVTLTVTDLNPEMLVVARQKFEPGENVTFAPADALDLDYADDTFDLVVCQFGVMFFPDRVQGYREAARVTRPGGTFMFSSWGSNSDNPYSEMTNNLLAEKFPENTPGFYKVPFFYNDIELIRSELAEAGLEDVGHTETAHLRRVPDFDQFAQGVVFGNPLFHEVTELGGDPVALRDELAALYRSRFGNEPAEMPLLAHIFEVRVP